MINRREKWKYYMIVVTMMMMRCMMIMKILLFLLKSYCFWLHIMVMKMTIVIYMRIAGLRTQ